MIMKTPEPGPFYKVENFDTKRREASASPASLYFVPIHARPYGSPFPISVGSPEQRSLDFFLFKLQQEMKDVRISFDFVWIE